MINDDTIKLLRECNAGIKMGVSSIDEVLDNVSAEKLKAILTDSRNEHDRLESDTEKLLEEYEDSGKDPNPMAKGMSWLKTNIMLTVNESDATIADLLTDGCNMGIKSLNKYLNQYEAAEERAKDIAKKLIKIEKTLADQLKEYL